MPATESNNRFKLLPTENIGYLFLSWRHEFQEQGQHHDFKTWLKLEPQNEKLGALNDPKHLDRFLFLLGGTESQRQKREMYRLSDKTA